jgi:predicted amidohydrolase
VLGIALVQINLYNNKAKPVEYVLKLLKKLGLSDSDIVCLPELWYAKVVKNFETEFYKNNMPQKNIIRS